MVFETYELAEKQFAELLHEHLPVNCGREMSFTPPANDDGGPFTTTVYYDCTEARATK